MPVSSHDSALVFCILSTPCESACLVLSGYCADHVSVRSNRSQAASASTRHSNTRYRPTKSPNLPVVGVFVPVTCVPTYFFRICAPAQHFHWYCHLTCVYRVRQSTGDNVSRCILRSSSLLFSSLLFKRLAWPGRSRQVISHKKGESAASVQVHPLAFPNVGQPYSGAACGTAR